MRFRASCLFVIPLLLLAQEPKPAAPPQAVDQALRERATAFLQYQVEGNFRKAYDLVAEDSKDFYFALAKSRIQSFEIEEVVYTNDFSTAVVRAAISRKTMVAGHEFEVPGVAADVWKVDGGKWFWYHDPKQDSSVPFFTGLVSGGGGGAPAEPVDPKVLPKDTSPAAVAAAAANLIQPPSVNKKSIAFTQGKAGDEEVTYHNGNRGQVQVSAWVEGHPKGFTVEPAATLVNAMSDLKLKIRYDPATAVLSAVRLRIEIEPFGTRYVLPVTIGRENSQKKR